MLPSFPDFGVAAELDIQIGNDNDSKEIADREARRQRNLPRILKIPFSVNVPVANVGIPQCIGEGPQQGRRWTIRRFVASLSQAVGATLPSSSTGTVSANQSGTGAASAIVLTVPAVAGQVNQVSSFTVSGTGATAGSTIVITLAGIQGGTQS